MHRVSQAAVSAAAFVSSAAFAQSLPAPSAPGVSTQRIQSEALDAVTATGALGNALTPDAPRQSATDLDNLPAETPCFDIQAVSVDDGPLSARTQQSVANVVGRCVGAHGLEAVRDHAANALIDDGYLTTRVTMPPQSIASGTLRLDVAPGRIGDIRTEGDAPGTLAAALPAHRGEILNQRGIDQALENIRRLSSQSNARFDIMPGDEPGESDIVLHPGTGKRWHALLAYDNAGQTSTGKNELTAAVVVDSPLGLYDQLQVVGMTNANRGAPGLGRDQAAAAYSVPFGYAMLSLDANRGSYLQSALTNYGMLQYEGVQKNAGVTLSGVVQRNARSRTELRARLFRAINQNQVNQTQIAVQNRDVYGYEIGAAHRRYIAGVQIDASIGVRASLPGISKNHGYVVENVSDNGAMTVRASDGRMQMETASVKVSAPFRIGRQQFQYQFGWSAQNALTAVSSPDYFTIGTRFSVRGFDQQSTLAAESGWAVSNELDWYVPTSRGTQAVYAGIDAGRVRGTAAQYLRGDTLVGMVAGVKGSVAAKQRFFEGVNYDISLGKPLRQPNGFSDRSVTLLAQVGALF